MLQQILDYFNSMASIVDEDCLLFRYNLSNELSAGDARLIDQARFRLPATNSARSVVLTVPLVCSCAFALASQEPTLG